MGLLPGVHLVAARGQALDGELAVLIGCGELVEIGLPGTERIGEDSNIAARCGLVVRCDGAFQSSPVQTQDHIEGGSRPEIGKVDAFA